MRGTTVRGKLKHFVTVCLKLIISGSCCLYANTFTKHIICSKIILLRTNRDKYFSLGKFWRHYFSLFAQSIIIVGRYFKKML